MFIEIGFIVSAVVTIVLVTSWLLMCFNVSLNVKFIGNFGLDTFYIAYPSFLFQVWFWSHKLGVFAL